MPFDRRAPEMGVLWKRFRGCRGTLRNVKAHCAHIKPGVCRKLRNALADMGGWLLQSHVLHQ
jgi:hypothetical protein